MQNSKQCHNIAMIHTIGILHPGDMGISIAAAAQREGKRVLWASEGRSAETRTRAEQHGLQDVGSLAAVCAQCDVLLSVCPPHGAEQLAADVAAAGFRGLYLDANAIAPARAKRMAQALTDAGITMVDGGIIGGPAWTAGATELVLSGSQAQAVAALFAGSPLATRVLGPEIGSASALKMCYAAFSKGSTALLAAILAAASANGVRDALEAQWAHDDAAMPANTERRIRAAAPKAWRWVGEMHEIADTLRAAGLPGDFHAGAADVYARLAGFKGADKPALDAIVAALVEN